MDVLPLSVDRDDKTTAGIGKRRGKRQGERRRCRHGSVLLLKHWQIPGGVVPLALLLWVIVRAHGKLPERGRGR
jgi:hypothetical protein